MSDDALDGDEDDDIDKDDDDDLDVEGRAEEEPLNSEDDVTDEDASDLFDTDNVVVCQYDKVFIFWLKFYYGIYNLIMTFFLR